MSKKRILILLLLPIVYFIGWISYLVVAEIGVPQVKIYAEGYDPRDLLSGHYLQLKLNWQKTDCLQFEDHKCPKDRFAPVYRFYIPEQEAQNLEKLIRNPDTKTELIFTYPEKREPKIKELWINGSKWSQALKE